MNIIYRILQSFEEVISGYPITNSTEVTFILRNKFAVAIQEFIANETEYNDGLKDSIEFSIITGNMSNVKLCDEYYCQDGPSAKIAIPRTVLSNVTTDSLHLVHSAFNTEALYLRRNSLLATVPYLRVGSALISASIVDEIISGLSDNELINITLGKDEVNMFCFN